MCLLHPQESSGVLHVPWAEGSFSLPIWLHPCFRDSLLFQEGGQVSPAAWGYIGGFGVVCFWLRLLQVAEDGLCVTHCLNVTAAVCHCSQRHLPSTKVNYLCRACRTALQSFLSLLQSTSCRRFNLTAAVRETAELQTAVPLRLSDPSGSQFSSLNQWKLLFGCWFFSAGLTKSTERGWWAADGLGSGDHTPHWCLSQCST